MRIHQSRVLTHVLAFALFAAGMLSVPPTAQAQTYTVLHYFTGGADGAGPNAGLTFDSAGNLYGTAAGGADAGCGGAGCGVVFELSPNSQGWSETTLYSFTGGSDGGYPLSGLTFDAEGNLYGTADVGGTAGCGDYGCGVVFELSPGSGGWTESVLIDFSNATGGSPLSGVVFDKEGNLYGTVPIAVYQLTRGNSGWNERVLDQMGGAAGPILDPAGNLYGTAGDPKLGIVWELLHGRWKERTLYPCGGGPKAGVVFDRHGDLFGTTSYGGKYQAGVVFKLTPGVKGKWKETVLHSFKGGSDGYAPIGAVAFDKAGNVYGTTEEGGDPSCDPPYGCGTVFKLTPEAEGKWKETILHRFKGSDGYGPGMEQLALDAAGNIYGTTSGGGNAGCGNYGCGVVFEITP